MNSPRSGHGVRWPLSPFAPAPEPRTPGEQFGPLALVYINAQKVSAPEVWLASLDGSTHRTIATYELGTVPDDLHGSLLALNGSHEVIVLDLATGAEQRVSAPGTDLPNAHIGVDGSVYVSVHGDDLQAGKYGTVLSRLDMATVARTPIAGFPASGIRILWDNPATNELLISPYGISTNDDGLRMIYATTGEQKWRRQILGCEWSDLASDGHQLITTSTSYDARDTAINYRVNVYTLPGPGYKELKLSLMAQPWHGFTYAPDGRYAAFSMYAGPGTPSAPRTSQGIWLLDTHTLTWTKLWQDDGIEAWPIAWTPDGTRLLVASDRGGDDCAYSILDAATGEAAPVHGLDRCGIYGAMVGVATLPTP